MAKINLLPWRAERRERRKREFFAHLGIAAVAAIVLVLLWGFWMSLRIDNQNNRNEYLQGQIAQLDSKITEIQNLQKVKKHLLDRKRIVEKLQSSRSQMVHLFDQVVQTIPAGARLTSLKQQGDKLTLDGVAQSNATVAEYMRNIEASPWMGPTTLVKTENVHGDSNMPYEFELVVALDKQKGDGDGSGPASGSSAAVAATAASAAPAASVAGTPMKASSTAGAMPPASAPAASTQAAQAPAPASATAATLASSAPVSSPAAAPSSTPAPKTAQPTTSAAVAPKSKGGARP
ncbi:MAG TPA: PilN domain-containing protein [Gemmataceae bacterium]|jgi:type IV pilus assembly protein PilN|nr:PilN domain-containing protein [Gemmataceae bacterium]